MFLGGAVVCKSIFLLATEFGQELGPLADRQGREFINDGVSEAS